MSDSTSQLKPPSPSSMLVETLATEMRKQWQVGERVYVESLADRVQPIASNHEAILDLIYHEMLIREEFGERTTLREYTQRFPNYALRLARLWTIHGAVESGSFLPEELAGSRSSKSAGKANKSGNGKSGADGNSTAAKSSLAGSSDPPGYEIIREIGRGGMAVVYEARHLSLGRTVAFKIVLTGSHVTKELFSRFLQEAQAVAHLQHPNIVQIYEVGEYDGRPFLSFEYMGGGTLHELLGGRPLPPTMAAQLIEMLARTIHFAHERGIVHRDLKPANILLEGRESKVESREPERRAVQVDGQDSDLSLAPRAKIGDFGLAKWLGAGNDLTVTGQVVGTPSYMAPEQAIGKGDDIGPPVDIYSLGAILYEMLTGRPPFQGATVLDTLDQVRSHDPVPLHRLQPKLPRDLETICLKCLEKQPHRRYPTALELAKDLYRFLNDQSITARPSGFIERGVKWTRRRPAVAALMVLVTIVSLIGVAGVMGQAHRANKNALQAMRERDTAERLRKVAQNEQAEAVAQRADAEAARVKADAAKKQAEANLQRTLQAVGTLKEMGDQLRQVSSQEFTGQRLLDQASGLYEGLLSDTNENPVVWYQAASTLISVGAVDDSLGQAEAAETAFRRAVELLDKVLAKHPELPHRGDRVAALWLLANNCRDQMKHEQAESVYKRTVSELNALIAESPDNFKLKISLSNTLINYCTTLIAVQRVDEAAEKYQQATALIREILRQDPQHIRARGELALCLDDHGLLLWQKGQREEAARLHQESFELRKKLADEFPQDPNCRVQLVRSRRSLARCHWAADKTDEALAEYQAARDLSKQIVVEFPNVMFFKREHADVLFDLVGFHRGSADRVTIATAVHDTVDVLSEINQRAPGDVRVSSLLVGLLIEDGETLWHQQRADEARQRYQRLLAIEERKAAAHPDDAIVANSVAWILATCPCEDLRDIPRAVVLAKRAVELSPTNAPILNTLGVAQYRAGDWSAAIETLNKSVDLGNGGHTTDWLFLAMAYWKNGQKELAKQWHDRAVAAAEKSPEVALETQRFYQEARTQLE